MPAIVRVQERLATQIGKQSRHNVLKWLPRSDNIVNSFCGVAEHPDPRTTTTRTRTPPPRHGVIGVAPRSRDLDIAAGAVAAASGVAELPGVRRAADHAGRDQQRL